MKISNLLNERLIKVDLESIDKEEVFEEMTDILYREGKIKDRDAGEARETTGRDCVIEFKYNVP